MNIGRKSLTSFRVGSSSKSKMIVGYLDVLIRGKFSRLKIFIMLNSRNTGRLTDLILCEELDLEQLLPGLDPS